MNSNQTIHPPTVLIVDDNPNNIKIVALVLRSLKYKLVIATNGRQAIEMADKTKPDLILLDIMMPEIDGFETCKIIKAKEEHQDTPIIFITALSDMENLVKGFSAGAVDYITKPFNKQELISRVKTHLDLKRTRDELQLTTEHLAELNNVKDKMFSVIGHDLRSPLGGVKFSLDMLSNGMIDPASEAFTETLQTLTKSTDEVFGLLENLLGWARSQSGNLHIETEDISVKDVTESIYLLHKVNIQQKQLTFKNHIASECKVKADMNTLKMILRNLVSNAIKFTPEKGTITLESEIAENQVRIKVIDTGVGIPAESIPKLFDSKQHITTYGTNRESGSGLGLVLCYDFARKNSGDISVESKIGKGTCFTVTLPVAQ